MKVLICIDDTDSLDSRGTGELAALLAGEITGRGWGDCGSVTRHQLYVHPDIPYTSHNSSMCFVSNMGEEHLAALTDLASRFLMEESAEGSDPGLCIAVVDRLADPHVLTEFGYRAKRSVIEMPEAYALASDAGIHLSSHGGTGQGVIGALAGVGLRLGGNDGRMRGSLAIPSVEGIAAVGDILAHPEVDVVRPLKGDPLPPEERIRFVDKVKTVLIGGEKVLLALPGDPVDGGVRWKTYTRRQLKEY